MKKLLSLNNLLNYLALATFVITILFFCPSGTVLQEQLRFYIFGILTGICLILFTIKTLKENNSIKYPKGLFILFVVIAAISIISSFLGLNQTKSIFGMQEVPFNSLIGVILLFIWSVIIFNFYKNKHIRTLFKLSIISAVILSVYNIFAVYLNLPLNLTGLSLTSLSIYLSINFFLSASLFLYAKTRKYKILYLVPSILILIFLILLNNFLALLTIGLGLVLKIIYNFFSKSKTANQKLEFVISGFIILVVFILGPKLFPEFPQISEITMPSEVNYSIALQAIQEKPLFGFGQGNYVQVYAKYLNENLFQPLNSRINFYLPANQITDWALSFGLIGFAAFIALIGRYLWLGYLKLEKIIKLANPDSQETFFTTKYFLLIILTFLSFLFYFEGVNSIIFWLILIFLSLELDNKVFEFKIKKSVYIIILVCFILISIGLIYFGIQVANAKYNLEKGNQEKLILLKNKRYPINTLGLTASIKQNYLALNQELQNNQNQETMLLLSSSLKEDINSWLQIEPNNSIVIWQVKPVLEDLFFLGYIEETQITDLYKKLENLEPNNPFVYINKGLFYYQVNSFLNNQETAITYINNAIENFKKAMELNPSLVYPYFNLGKIYLDQQDSQKARDIIEQGLLIEALSDNQELNELLSTIQ